MTDLELLELAAKAAGIPDGYWNCEYHDHGHGEYWNPLESNENALWLAVKLKLSIKNGEQDLGINVWFVHSKDQLIKVHEICGDDPETAVRYAIVRAAAEIGKGMK